MPTDIRERGRGLPEGDRGLRPRPVLGAGGTHTRVVPVSEGGPGVDIHLAVIASVGKAGEVQKEQYVCGICGFASTEVGKCPRCKMQNEEAAKGLREAFLRKVDEFLDGKWEDSEAESGR